MRSRTRYQLARIEVASVDSRPASWTFAGDAMRGTEFAYSVTDGNLPSRKHWGFIVRVPEDPKGRIEVRPRTTPSLKAWAELPDRSLTFSLATKGTARGKWYCQVALADATGEKSKTVVNTKSRSALPHWFKDVAGRMRKKEAVKPTKGTDGNALVVIVPAGDHAAMIRLYFATKVWILSENVVV